MFFFIALTLFSQSVAGGGDLVDRVRHGRAIEFSEVLDARHNPERLAEYEDLKEWVERPTKEELSQFYVRLPGKKEYFRERVPCWEADTKGYVRAMVVAASASTTEEAHRTWQKAEAAYSRGRALETIARENAAATAEARPTKLGKDLALRGALDQAWRKAQNEQTYNKVESEVVLWRLWSSICHITFDNVKFIKEKIEANEWPLISRDGPEAAHDAFLIVQHADDDLEFQKRVLKVIERHAKSGEVDGAQYAALFDRVALGSGRPQRYATQFSAREDGCAAVRPIEDPQGVDERRAKLGLPPIAQYAKTLAEKYKVEICADLFNDAERIERSSA